MVTARAGGPAVVAEAPKLGSGWFGYLVGNSVVAEVPKLGSGWFARWACADQGTANPRSWFPRRMSGTRVGGVGMRSGAAGEVSRRWLERMGASAQTSAAVCDDVAARLDAMPSVLRSGFRAIDAGLAALPGAVRSRAHLVPGIGEYVRVVDSLTAVSYFDALTRAGSVPMPRTPEAALAESRA